MGKGEIHSREAYAQGKMLDHSRWAGKLRNNITPSDIDAVFDNAGSMIFLELSSQVQTWNKLSHGQRWLNWNLLRQWEGTQHLASVAVLGYHQTPVQQAIDTYGGLVSIQLLYFWDCVLWESEVIDGARWPEFVCTWFEIPQGNAVQCFEFLRGFAPASKVFPGGAS